MKYSYNNYRGKQFIEQKIDKLASKKITHKCNRFIQKIGTLFHALNHLPQTYSTPDMSNITAYYAKSLKEQLTKDLFDDIEFSHMDKELCDSLKNEIYGYIKYRVKEFN